MPVFARDVLHGGANTYGFLMSSAGIGAVTGTIYLASRKDARGLIKTIPDRSCLCGASITSLCVVPGREIFRVASCTLPGFAMMLLIASSNTIIQTIVDEDKRGRMMSLFAMSLMGMMPIWQPACRCCGETYRGTDTPCLPVRPFALQEPLFSPAGSRASVVCSSRYFPELNRRLGINKILMKFV